MTQKKKAEEGISIYQEEKDIVAEFNHNWHRSSEKRRLKHTRYQKRNFL